ncbi:hypothetical protein [Marinomonas balearica]|uniref:Uncharacterized protein n=1 Tax=Marinomonas balearica TaxID=491947 RepID=A0A4R6M9Z2_9GAMM|nr:hypothetical protein [Marinomonas balearica]TDO98046.1 hypothetical protein DFP79_1678 [Marinomonas balearica]
MNVRGTLIALGVSCFLLSLIPQLSFLLYFSAFFYWVVLALSLNRLNQRNRFQVLFLLSAGVSCTAFAFVVGELTLINIAVLVKANLGITSMLVGVSFLSLLPHPQQDKRNLLGVKGAVSTWGSVHLLGAVINLSSVFLVGDRLQRSHPLSDAQLGIIVRALTCAGFWSPFFASMAIAFSVAPNASYSDLVSIGVPVSITAFLFSMWELKHTNRVDSFIGFPISLSSLLFPVFLASAVLVIHYQILKDMPILSIVTFVCPLSVLGLLLIQGGKHAAQRKVRDHISFRLPNMINEVSLFISAGFMSASVSLLVGYLLGDSWSLFDSFGFWAAFSCYIAICIISLIGLHPIVGISLMSALVPFEEVNNTLLALVCISAWGVGTAIGPLSGINLSVAGKYELDNIKLSRLNIRYGVFMSAVVAVAMYAVVLLSEMQ